MVGHLHNLLNLRPITLVTLGTAHSRDSNVTLFPLLYCPPRPRDCFVTTNLAFVLSPFSPAPNPLPRGSHQFILL